MAVTKSKSKAATQKLAAWRHSKPARKTIGKTSPESSIAHSSKSAWANPTGLKPLQVVKQLSATFDLSVRDVAGVLDVAPKTISRWHGKDSALSEQQADRMMILKSIFDLGTRVLGSDENVKKWIREPIFSLDGQTPLALLKTESGRRRIESVLHQIEYGFF
jgi:putative toxin-antitoxin system antitoxin component (TIGR02293 family)